MSTKPPALNYLRAAINSYTYRQDAVLASRRYNSLGKYKEATLAAIYLTADGQTLPAIAAFASAVKASEVLVSKPPATSAAARRFPRRLRLGSGGTVRFGALAGCVQRHICDPASPQPSGCCQGVRSSRRDAIISVCSNLEITPPSPGQKRVDLVGGFDCWIICPHRVGCAAAGATRSWQRIFHLQRHRPNQPLHPHTAQGRAYPWQCARPEKPAPTGCLVFGGVGHTLSATFWHSGGPVYRHIRCHPGRGQRLSRGLAQHPDHGLH